LVTVFISEQNARQRNNSGIINRAARNVTQLPSVPCLFHPSCPHPQQQQHGGRLTIKHTHKHTALTRRLNFARVGDRSLASEPVIDDGAELGVPVVPGHRVEVHRRVAVNGLVAQRRGVLRGHVRRGRDLHREKTKRREKREKVSNDRYS